MATHRSILLAVLLMCISSTIAQESCVTSGELRFERFSTSTTAGRVEICRDNVWGSICVDNDQVAWSEKNAQVACRELEFSGALNSLLQKTAPAPPSGTPSHYYSVRCNGTEESIAQCTSKSGINTTICTTSRAAHVVCRKDETYLDVRLVGDTTNGEGAVEVYDRIHRWVSLCPDSMLWGNSQASAVCVQLGYEGGRTMTYMVAESTSGGSTIAARRVADIDCSGEGAFTLQECSVDFPVGTTCSAGPRQFAGVVCNSSSLSAGSLRLFGVNGTGTNVERGRVEVLYDGRWGAVCGDTQWSSSDGQAACRELGFEITSFNQVVINPFDLGNLAQSTNLPVWLGGLQCDTSSNKLSTCERNDESIGYAVVCDQRDTVIDRDATLDCNNKDETYLDVRLVGDTTNGEGAVEVYDRIHRWVSLCPDSMLWGNSQASAVCVQLGYEGGRTMTYMVAESTSGGSTIAARRVANIDCSGEGAFTLQECSVDFPVGKTCSAGPRQFAGVVCNSSRSSLYGDRLIIIQLVSWTLLSLTLLL